MILIHSLPFIRLSFQIVFIPLFTLRYCCYTITVVLPLLLSVT